MNQKPLKTKNEGEKDGDIVGFDSEQRQANG